METAIQRKVRYRGNLKKHLKCMNYLSLRPITESDLTNVEDTDRLFNEIKSLNFEKKKKIYLNQSDTVFNQIRLALRDSENESFYVITEHSFDSGILKLSSFNDFNWQFNFETLNFYHVSLLLYNFSNEITFWEADEDSENKIEVEIFGEDWTTILSKL